MIRNNCQYLSFATYLLATNPKIQQRLHHEISINLSHSSSSNYDSVSELKYLDIMISETLRIYLPAFKVNREIKEDIVCNGLQTIKIP